MHSLQNFSLHITEKFKMFSLKCFPLFHTSGNCKVNDSQARHPKASKEDDDGHLGYMSHFPYSLSGPWNSRKRKHFCNKHKLKVKVCQWGPMLRLFFLLMRIKQVKYFCDRCLSLPGNYTEKRMVCLLFAVLLNIYVGVHTVTPSNVTSLKWAAIINFTICFQFQNKSDYSNSCSDVSFSICHKLN